MGQRPPLLISLRTAGLIDVYPKRWPTYRTIFVSLCEQICKNSIIKRMMLQQTASHRRTKTGLHWTQTYRRRPMARSCWFIFIQYLRVR